MGRIEVLTGIERRRRWSDEDKARLLCEAAAIGYGGIAAVARRHDVHPNQLYKWKRDLSEACQEAPPLFLPVELDAAETAASPVAPPSLSAVPDVGDTIVEVGFANGRTLKMPPGLADECVSRLIRLVEGV